MKAVRVFGTESTVKSGPAALQIGTALLVKVSVFRCKLLTASSVGLPEL